MSKAYYLPSENEVPENLHNAIDLCEYKTINEDIKFYNDAVDLKCTTKRRGYAQLDTVSLSSFGRSIDEQSAITKQSFIGNSTITIDNISDSGGGDFIEDSEHRNLLQLYVFVARCIAHPFNVRQPTDMTRRKTKVTKNALTVIRERFTTYLEGKTNIISDEAFRNAVQSYTDTLLWSERIAKMVNTGSYSSDEFRDHFKSSIEKRVRKLPCVDGVSKETVLSSWMSKFDAIYRGDVNETTTHSTLETTAHSELILSKERLFNMFQTILGIKEYEHQILFNACKLGNQDEQVSHIRTELRSRQKIATNLSKEDIPKFIHKNMEEIYVEEKKAQVKQMMAIHLETFPITRSRFEFKAGVDQMQRERSNAIFTIDVNNGSDAVLNKIVTGLSFKLQVTVLEATGLSTLPRDRLLFAVIKFKGNEMLRTDMVEAGNLTWQTSFEWVTNQPLPLLNLKLMVEDFPLLRLHNGKRIATLPITPYCGMSDSYKWYTMTERKGWTGDEIKIKLSIRMERPPNVKKSGFLYAKGKKIWKTWEKRYFMLIQVSQHNFALCSYRIKKQEPKEIMLIDGYTADFAVRTDEYDGRCFFFKLTKADDEIIFAAEKDSYRRYWFRKFFQTTGQQLSPIMISSRDDETRSSVKGGMDCVTKHSLDDLVVADAFSFDQAELFATLQRLTLLHRLNDSYTCLGWFSPGQAFVLDEYVARYDVRGCHRHLCYLDDLLERAENSITIDPTLLHNSYAFCASHVVRNRPDGVNTVTMDESYRFEDMKDRLRSYLISQITHFRDCFPFGRPEGALKGTLTLFARVMSEDTKSSDNPAGYDEVKESIKACLYNAALVNYSSISTFAKVEESFHGDALPKEKLAIILQLAELCIELIKQNEEYHAEAFASYNDLVLEHMEIFWSLFAVDMDDALQFQLPDTWDSFALFRMLNNYLRAESPLRDGKFHRHLTSKFAPLVVRYIDLTESAISRSVDKGFQKVIHQPVGNVCATSEEIFRKLQSTKNFIEDLHWPNEEFANHIANRLRQLSADMAEDSVTRVLDDFGKVMSGSVSSDYIVPEKACVMINVICEAHEQIGLLDHTDPGETSQYRYHSNADQFIQATKVHTMDMIVARLCMMLQESLKELSQIDHGTISPNILSLVKREEEAVNDFYQFIVMNTRQFKGNITNQFYITNLEKALWEKICVMLCTWLTSRLEVPLHLYQFKVLRGIIELCQHLFQQEGFTDTDLENDNYKALYAKLQREETILNVNETSMLTPDVTVKGYENHVQTTYLDYEVI